MYSRIKQLADEALAIQNKDKMDAALREISAICDMPDETNYLLDSAENAKHLGNSISQLGEKIGVMYDYNAPEENPILLSAAEPETKQEGAE
ncbi:MAG: hypothetical protein ACXWJZ_01490 [Burkholderiaceae bacterium]